MPHHRLTTLLPALLLAWGATTVAAAPRSADTVYQQERAACLEGRSSQDRATCLKEAGAARAEARRQGLDNGETPAQLRANALLRCQRVAADDRASCERMALGEGQRDGSVAEGAVVKQLTTRSAAPMPAPAASR
jgi:hypothetical protein